MKLVRFQDNALAAVLIAALRQAQLSTSETRFDGLDFAESAAQDLADQYSAIVHAIAEGDGDRAGELLANTHRGGSRPTGSSALKWAG
jgi:DNA-binding FadR family transcriptional regulator